MHQNVISLEWNFLTAGMSIGIKSKLKNKEFWLLMDYLSFGLNAYLTIYIYFEFVLF